MEWIINKLKTAFAAEKPKNRPWWLVHFGEGICNKLPDSYQICVFAEDWEPGYIYVPLGSILVQADNEKEALDNALMYRLDGELVGDVKPPGPLRGNGTAPEKSLR